MSDRMSREARSRVMRAIRSRWTRQERLFASLCSGWDRGTGRELNADFVFHAAQVAVFLDGDFWHGRNLPVSLPVSWRAKLGRNRERDARKRAELEGRGWAVVSIWESEFLSDPEGHVSDVVALVAEREEDMRWVPV